MGILLGKFRKKNTYEILEKLENEIVNIEEFSRSTELYRKKVIGRFILLAISIYLMLAFALYIYYNKISSNEKVIYIVPLVAFPFIIFIIKNFLAWYYKKKLQRNEKKLVKLKEEKKKMIDNVMETETYKVAKKILDKFGNEGRKSAPELSVATSNVVLRTNQTGLRERKNATLSFGTPKTPAFGDKVFPESSAIIERRFPQPTPYLPLARSAIGPAQNLLQATPRAVNLAITGAPSLSPKNVFPSNRSVMDKLVDYLIGDGPSNRFALICKKCSGHNGMALKEEFEYLSFTCCYCTHFNPSRKIRPTGPKYETPSKMSSVEDSSDSDSDTRESETEIQHQPLNVNQRRSSSDSDVPAPARCINKTASEIRVTKQSSVNRNSSPELEKYSDFDVLSDCESREGDNVNNSPVSPEAVVSTTTAELVGVEQTTESPMEIDQNKSVVDES